jgi:hypothetical protein
VTAWDTDLAFERARTAYRYVAANFPDSSDLEVLAPHIEAAHEAQRRGDMPAYLDAFRELMKTTRREAQRRAA